jgi:hypothetical protein
MKDLNKKIQAQFDKMSKTGTLYRVELSGSDIWDVYLKGFGNDPIFRDPGSSEHNCNHCNNFVRRYGNIVALDADLKLMSIFHVETTEEYQNSMDLMNNYIVTSKIANVFFETFEELNSLPYEVCKKSADVFRLGIDKNHKRYTEAEANLYGVVEKDEVKTFNHFHLNLDSHFVDHSKKSIESIMSDYRSAKEVFKRGMDEISCDTLVLVKDLINQGSLLDGQTHLFKVEQIIPLATEYAKVSESDKDSWCWAKSRGLAFAKFKNELIGVLCSELSEGEEINKACQSWNKRVDPANYMKATAPITASQIKAAEQFMVDNGYVESFDRRLATIDDISASEIQHMNIGADKIPSVTLFGDVKATKTQHKRNQFDNIEEVSVDKFMSEILPSCTSVSLYLKNNHDKNMATLTTANVKESKPIFKWGNNYSWSFNGNLAGKSQIKEEVKSQGGKVDGVLRFSIMWAEDAMDASDLDAHCFEPSRNKIYYGSKNSPRTGGNLDIDITDPQGHKRQTGRAVVENITYPSLDRMEDGTYVFSVHQFSDRQSRGFKAEIEFDGQLFSYEYNSGLPSKSTVEVAKVSLSNREFTIAHVLPATDGEGVKREVYGLETNQFHKVNLMCLSPNHWDTNKVGNKHYFFMLDGCTAENSVRGFHNENLAADLLAHKKVIEVLGSTKMIDSKGKQLSGLGFNATVRDEVIVKLEGSFKRTVKIKF